MLDVVFKSISALAVAIVVAAVVAFPASAQESMMTCSIRCGGWYGACVGNCPIAKQINNNPDITEQQAIQMMENDACCNACMTGMQQCLECDETSRQNYKAPAEIADAETQKKLICATGCAVDVAIESVDACGQIDVAALAAESDSVRTRFEELIKANPCLGNFKAKLDSCLDACGI